MHKSSGPNAAATLSALTRCSLTRSADFLEKDVSRMKAKRIRRFQAGSPSVRRLNEIRREAGLVPSGSHSRRRLQVLGLTVVILFAAIGGNYALDGWSYLKSHQLVRQFDSAVDTEIDEAVGALSLLGAAGVAGLVEGLAHPRPEVRRASQEKITDLVDSWHARDLPTSSEHVLHLSRCLATKVDKIPLEDRKYAANLATELLLWPVDVNTEKTTQFVMNCELILRSGLRSREATANPQDSGFEESVGLARSQPMNRILQSGSVRPPAQLGWADPFVAGGGLPIQPLDVPPTEPELSKHDLEVPQRFTPHQDMAALPMAPKPRAVWANQSQTPVRDPSVMPPEMVRSSPAGLPMVRLSHIEVLHRLHVTDRGVREEALAELQRRGFSNELIHVGRQATSTTESERLELVVALRNRKDIDPLPWLRYLVKDHQADVSDQALLALSELADPAEARLAREQLASSRNLTQDRGGIQLQR